MDDFGIDRPELTGALMSLEFGSGGRIHQLWIANPMANEDNLERQFVLGPVSLEEDYVEEYFPGAILIGARTKPEDPWIVSRNNEARIVGEDDDPTQIKFEYDFALLPELGATGHFYERTGTGVPHFVWELTIENRGKISLEIGELGFPFALDNFYQGFPKTTAGQRLLSEDRIIIHKALNGAASYLHAQRLNGEPPGLLITPADDTVWEFYNTAPGTLRGNDDWAGIPIVYIFSKATIEREEWPEWMNGNTSLIMEPGDVRTFRTLFVPTDSGESAGALATLASIDQPTIGLFPGAVAPADVGIMVQVVGATPTQVFSDSEATLEAESEEDQGSCLVTPISPGPSRFSFEDTQGRTSWCNLLFIEPIETLIKRRASWIIEHQVQHGGMLDGAILMADVEAGTPLNDLEDFNTPFGLQCSLSDALFLAEKNRIFPEEAEAAVLEEYLRFIQRAVQNPGTFAVGTHFEEDHATSTETGELSCYLLLGSLLNAWSKNSRFDDLPEERVRLLEWAGETIKVARERAGYPGVIEELHARRQFQPGRRRGDPATHDASVIGEMISDPGVLDFSKGSQRYKIAPSYARRSLSPSWWWYGSDQEYARTDRMRNRAVLDKGELCLTPSTAAFSALGLRALNRDRGELPYGQLRLAFGGLLGVWALVRPDGAAAHAFCPDAASDQFGMSPVTGTVGLALYHYLRLATAYVVPQAEFAFGCHAVTEADWLKVVPWDGVGQRIVVRSYDVEVAAVRGRILEFRLKKDRSAAVMRLQNTSNRAEVLSVAVSGLWGRVATINGEETHLSDGWFTVTVSCEPKSEAIAEIRIKN